MPQPPSLSPAPRMRRSIEVEVVTEQGRGRGSTWWLDLCYLVLVLPRPLSPGEPVLLTLPTLGSPAVLLGRVVARGAARAPEGWVHSVRWVRRDRGPADRLLARLRDEDADFGRIIRPAAGMSVAASARVAGAPGRLVPSIRAERRLRLAGLGSQGGGHRVAGDEGRGAVDSVQPPRVAPDPDGPALAPIVSPGSPTSLLLFIPHLDSMVDTVAVIGGTIRLTLGATEGLRPGEPVIVAMQLPRGLFVQFDATITALDARALIVESDGSAPGTRTILRELILRSVG